MATIHNLIDEWSKLGPIAWAENDYGWIVEDGSAIQPVDWQRVILSEYWQRQADVSTLLVSTVKKTGKTTLTSLITCWRWLTIPSVHFIVANDASQVEELQFNIIAGMIQRHPILRKYSKVTRDTITFTPTGSRIVSLPMDAAGAAGANFASVSFSELWGYRYEEGQRLYEELTPIPGDCLRLIDSYAGFVNESELLQRVWDRGLSGQRINDEWPIYLAGQQLSYIHQGEDAQAACWRGTEAERLAYYAEQKASLRENTFARLHLNQWVSGESNFVSLEEWQACISEYHKPLPAYSPQKLFIGLDLAVGPKGDDCALCAVYGEHPLIKLALHRVWAGKDRKMQLKLKESVLPFLLDLKAKYHIAGIFYDPWQAVYLSEDLRSYGLRTFPITQSHAGRGPKDTFLYDAIMDKRLVLYDHPELRNLATQATAKELPNGQIFLQKSSGRSKIDLLVSLSNVCDEAGKKRGIFVG